MKKSAPATPSAAPTPSVASTAASKSASASASAAASPSPPIPDDMARRIAEAKKRVADAQSKLAVKDNPYMVRRSLVVRELY